MNLGPMISLMVWATRACSSLPAMVRGLGVPVLRLMPAPVVILMPLDATVGKNAMECFRIRTIQSEIKTKIYEDSNFGYYNKYHASGSL